jgi:hypothetical protein
MATNQDEDMKEIKVNHKKSRRLLKMKNENWRDENGRYGAWQQSKVKDIVNLTAKMRNSKEMETRNAHTIDMCNPAHCWGGHVYMRGDEEMRWNDNWRMKKQSWRTRNVDENETNFQIWTMGMSDHHPLATLME